VYTYRIIRRAVTLAISRCMSLSCIHSRAGCSIVEGSGNIRPCCKFSDPNSTTDIFSVNSLNEYLDLAPYVQVRDSLDSGVFPPGCVSCNTIESAGLRSRRLETQDLYGVNPPGSGLVDLEIGLDYTCNMMCRSCGAGASSRWGAAADVLAEFERLDIPTQRQYNYSAYAERFRTVLNNTDLSSVRHCKIEGGEPFYSKNLGGFLTRLADHAEDTSRVTVNIFTNGSVFPPQSTLDLLDQFDTRITFSLDAVGLLATVMRWGVPWEVVEENIRRWCALDCYRPIVCPTVGILNVNRIGSLVEFCDALGLRMDFSELTNPRYLSMYQLDLETRKRWCLGIPKFDGLLMADIHYEPEFERLRDSTRILDQYQGVSFSEANPEIAQLVGM